MKNYKETKQAMKELILTKGISNILNADLCNLYAQGHKVGNVQNALSYFLYSPQAAKYRA